MTHGLQSLSSHYEYLSMWEMQSTMTVKLCVYVGVGIMSLISPNQRECCIDLKKYSENAFLGWKCAVYVPFNFNQHCLIIAFCFYKLSKAYYLPNCFWILFHKQLSEPSIWFQKKKMKGMLQVQPHLFCLLTRDHSSQTPGWRSPPLSLWSSLDVSLASTFETFHICFKYLKTSIWLIHQISPLW